MGKKLKQISSEGKEVSYRMGLFFVCGATTTTTTTKLLSTPT